MRRILIRSPNWIGDQVMAYVFFKSLRDQYPRAWIAVVCTEWVRDIQFRGFVDEIFVIPKKKSDGWWDSFKKIRSLALRIKENGPWDLGISMPNSFGSALLIYWSGATLRRGYNTDARGILLNQKMKWNSDPNIHRSDVYAKLLLKDLPVKAKDYWLMSEEKNFDPIKHWPDVLSLDPPEKNYVVIAPGAVADSRRWSTAQFAELIELIYEKHGLRSVIVGGIAEREIAESFLKRDLPVINYTVKGSVSSLWRIFRQAKFTISNDSGLAHVASLCGSPTYIIWGAGEPRRTEPIGPGVVQLKLNAIECWPCEKNTCDLPGNQKNKCLLDIRPFSVLEDL
jgi:heptosyltransferase-2